MEEMLLNWPLLGESVEPSRPLTPQSTDDNELNLSFNLDKHTRNEIESNFLNHFDDLSKTLLETEPFDWFSIEKSINIPILENQPHIYNGIPISNEPWPNYPFVVESSAYSPTIVPSHYPVNVSTTGTAETQLIYTSSFNDVVSTSILSNDAVVPTSEPNKDIVILQQEMLTPPESPRDDDLMTLLQEIEPADLDKLLLHSETTNSSVMSENTFSIDELSDYVASSPSVSSEKDYIIPSPSVGSEKDYFAWSPSVSSEDYISSHPAVGSEDYVASSPSVSSENGSDDSGDEPPSKVRRLTKSSKTSVSTSADSKPRKEHTERDRKSRKKEQNKNAAIRYRMKKKQESEESLNEEKQMQDRNDELRTQLDDLMREVKCLKSLMRDVYRKKGLIK